MKILKKKKVFKQSSIYLNYQIQVFIIEIQNRFLKKIVALC